MGIDMCNPSKTTAAKDSIGNNMDDEPICESWTTNSLLECYFMPLSTPVQIFPTQWVEWLDLPTNKRSLIPQLWRLLPSVMQTQKIKQYCQISLWLQARMLRRWRLPWTLWIWRLIQYIHLVQSPDTNTSSILTTDELIWQQLNELHPDQAIHQQVLHIQRICQRWKHCHSYNI